MQLSTSRRTAGQAGYTVSELLVSMVLASLAMAAFTSFNRFQLFALRNQARQVDVQTEARSLLELFAREIRQAGTNPTCAAGISALADAKQHLLRVQADLNGDGVLTGANEDVTYEYKFDQNRVERTANGTSLSLVSRTDVSGSRIRYFDGAGTEITAGLTGLVAADRARVRRVRFELRLAEAGADPQNATPLRAYVSTDVDLRNRFFVSDVTCN